MTPNGRGKGWKRVIPATLALAVAAAVIPATGGGAVVRELATLPQALDTSFLPFTPANTDPALARRVAALGIDALRFTPAAKPQRTERVVTMAVRVDEASARAITVRRSLADAAAPGKLGGALSSVPQLEPTRYSLGSARGFQRFAAPAPKGSALPESIREISMADLSSYGANAQEKSGKPSRFQPRIAFEQDSVPGRSPRTMEGSGDQTVDVGGAYRVTRNLDVTAGVRVSQERDRMAPLTDGVEDDKAVYVGTQFRF